MSVSGNLNIGGGVVSAFWRSGYSVAGKDLLWLLFCRGIHPERVMIVS